MFFFFLALVAAVEGCRNGYLVSSGLTCAQKKEILDTHNELRNIVAAGKIKNLLPAQNMLEMRWSEVAANTAQILADQCVFEHNTNIVRLKNKIPLNRPFINEYFVTCTTYSNGVETIKVNKSIWKAVGNYASTANGGVQVGQNLAIFRSLGNVDLSNVLRNLMNGWIEEGDKFIPGQFSSETGHYSQMIWGNSGYVGCGYSVYKQNGFDNRLLVCNYLPPGNYIGQLPYIYGNTNCVRHGKFRSTKYSHLCAIDRNRIKVC